MCMYVYLCYVHSWMQCTHSSEEANRDALQLELQVTLDCIIQVLGTELWFSAEGVHAFTCWAFASFSVFKLKTWCFIFNLCSPVISTVISTTGNLFFFFFFFGHLFLSSKNSMESLNKLFQSYLSLLIKKINLL